MSRRARARLEVLSRRDGYRRRAAIASPFIILTITLSIGIALGVLHNRWRVQSRPDPVMNGIRTTLFPFQYGAARMEGSLLAVWSWFLPGRRLAEENARLRAEVARLKMANQSLQADSAEAARLRAALGFAEKTRRDLLAAEVTNVLARRSSPLFDTITIARGARDGVRPGQVVRTPDGLLGQVSEVSALSSQVTLLTDVNSGVGGLVVRGGKVQGVGIVQGGGREKPLQIVYLKREDDIKIGDRVISSGYGGVVPAEVPIGKVISVTDDRAKFLKSARIAPATALHHAREVFLLR